MRVLDQTPASEQLGNNTKLSLSPTPETLPLKLPLFWHRRWGIVTAAAPYLWLTCIGVLSFLPPPSMKGQLHTRGSFHIPAHILVFAISTFIARRASQSPGRRIILCSLVVAYGCALEILQAWIFRSPLEWVDVTIDTCGVLLALAIATSVNAAVLILQDSASGKGSVTSRLQSCVARSGQYPRSSRRVLHLGEND